MSTPLRARSRRMALAASIAVLALGAAPALAATPDDSVATVSVARAFVSPASMKQARRSLAVLENAALEACGASFFSLREQREAVRGSACWRTSMDDAVARIDNDYLTATYRGTTPTVNLVMSGGGGSALRR